MKSSIKKAMVRHRYKELTGKDPKVVEDLSPASKKRVLWEEEQQSRLSSTPKKAAPRSPSPRHGRAGGSGGNLGIALLTVHSRHNPAHSLSFSFFPAGSKSSGGVRGSPGGGNSQANYSQSKQFRTQLADLVALFGVTNLSFIRCIKPNHVKQPMIYNAPFVLQQLSYSGVLEAVTIRKSGYPFRMDHLTFVRRYRLLLPQEDREMAREKGIGDRMSQEERQVRGRVWHS
jgi:hypothetical protein